MNVLVAVDAQLLRTPDGKVWTRTIYEYDFWSRYLDVFETISVVSRMQDVSYNEVEGCLRTDGERVSFKALPMACGAKEYIKQLPAFICAARTSIKGEQCAIIRLPSIASTFIELAFRITHKPYALEVVVDPVNAFEGSVVASKLITCHLKSACKKANGVSYVTQYALQELYLSSARIRGNSTNEYFETYYSSIVLNRDYFAPARDYTNLGKKIKLVHTANNVKNYIKGHEVVINIVKKLNDVGIDAEVVFVGDGERRKEFEQIAKNLGIGHKVSFTGLIPSSLAVRERLLNADIFVFPTRCEGLPRAVIEAMAVGLPCLSTPVNGIPELLESEYLFDPFDVEGFTSKIIELVNNTKKMNEMSSRNIEKAKEFESSILQKRRMEFYLKLKELCSVK